MKPNMLSTLRRGSAALLAATFACTALAQAQQVRSWDPFQHSGLEGGGWTHAIQPPQPNVPTHWDMTTWPAAQPSHAGRLPPVGGPIHGMMPSTQAGRYTSHPQAAMGHAVVPAGAGHAGFSQPAAGQPALGGPAFGAVMGHAVVPAGAGHAGFSQPAVGQPALGGSAFGSVPSGVVVSVGIPPAGGYQPAMGGLPADMQAIAGPASSMMAVNSGLVPGAGLSVPPQPAMDDLGPAAPGITVPEGMFGVVVANQSSNTVKVLTRFVDPQSGGWIARWADPVAPGQAVRLGVTTLGTFFLRVDATAPSGAVVPLLDGNDAVVLGPNGALGLRRARFIQQGSDLIAVIGD